MLTNRVQNGKMIVKFIILTVGLSLSISSFAQLNKRQQRVSTSGFFELSSNYLYRGFSLSNENFSAKGNFNVSFLATPYIGWGVSGSGASVANADLEAHVQGHIRLKLPINTWLVFGNRIVHYNQARRVIQLSDYSNLNLSEYPDLLTANVFEPLGNLNYQELISGFGFNWRILSMEITLNTIQNLSGTDFQTLFPSFQNVSSSNYIQFDGNFLGLDFVLGWFEEAKIRNLEVHYVYRVKDFYIRYVYQRWEQQSNNTLSSIFSVREENNKQSISFGINF